MEHNSDYLSKLERIELIFKTVERCNIDCTYCYYFNGGNDSYENYKPYINKETIENITQFLIQGAKDFGLKEVIFDLHGGEPMMQKKSEFDEMLTYFRRELSPYVNLIFGMQTNGILVDDEWIELFSKHDVHVGVSIDGPKLYNDKYRIDHRGKGTYDSVVKGIRLLQDAAEKGLVNTPGALCVVNPDHDIDKIFNHFYHDLNLDAMDFLLPDYDHQSFDSTRLPDYSKALCKMFDLWVENGFDKIYIRTIRSLLKRLSGTKLSGIFGFTEQAYTGMAFVIQNNGDLNPDDLLRTTPFWKKYKTLNVKDTTLREFLNDSVIQEVNNQSRRIPDKCVQCCWGKVCGGGDSIQHRYSDENESFNNPSIYCDALQEFYSHMTAYLLNNGMALSDLEKVLFDDEEIVEIEQVKQSTSAIA